MVLSPNKFAKLLRKSTRYKKGQLAHFWVGVIQPSRKTSIFQNDEIASISTGLDESFTLRVKELLSSLPDLTNPWTALPPVRSEFDHHIELTGPVKRQRINRLSPAEKEELVRQCQEYLSMNHTYKLACNGRTICLKARRWVTTVCRLPWS